MIKRLAGNVSCNTTGTGKSSFRFAARSWCTSSFRRCSPTQEELNSWLPNFAVLTQYRPRPHWKASTTEFGSNRWVKLKTSQASLTLIRRRIWSRTRAALVSGLTTAQTLIPYNFLQNKFYFFTSFGRAFVERLHRRQSPVVSVVRFACGFAGSHCIWADCRGYSGSEEARSNRKKQCPASTGSKVTFQGSKTDHI